jgi:phosphatidylglycerol---prolipoprotein diacylglyceryl transferase
LHPVLWSSGPIVLRSYTVFLVIAFVVALAMRRHEATRLGHGALVGYRWIPAGALLGAVVGAKLGMVLCDPAAAGEAWTRIASLDFTGKTVTGGLVGGYLGVEVTKRIVGITRRTGDAFAVAVPLAQAIGRLGCLFHGCCYGTAWSGPWAVSMGGLSRHPAQIYEALLDLALAVWIWTRRHRPMPEGNLFRRYLVGYAAIRFVLEPLRGDAGWKLGPLTGVQVLCLVVIGVFGNGLVRSEARRTTAPDSIR